MQLYNLYQEHAIKLYITSSRIIQLQIINFNSVTNITVNNDTFFLHIKLKNRNLLLKL